MPSIAIMDSNSIQLPAIAVACIKEKSIVGSNKWTDCTAVGENQNDIADGKNNIAVGEDQNDVAGGENSIAAGEAQNDMAGGENDAGWENLFQPVNESTFKGYFNNEQELGESFTQLPQAIHITRSLNPRIMVVVPDE
ncbi:uncharacterized protein TNCV_4569581 [Trichonephila clavipes]|nr:uncharacterized protein TNCV_4569581 [Trichonephila clavipes]